MNEFEGKTDSELRALGRIAVERIAELADTPGLAQDEIELHKGRAQALLVELRRRGVPRGE